MSKSDEKRSGSGLRAAQMAMIALVVPVLSSVVLAGLLDDAAMPPTTVPVAQVAPPPAQVMPIQAKTTANTDIAYQLRCWQDGRLIFEENGLTAPVKAGRPVLAMQSREGGADLHLIETGNTTCLIQQRSAADSRRQPIQP